MLFNLMFFSSWLACVAPGRRIMLDKRDSAIFEVLDPTEDWPKSGAPAHQSTQLGLRNALADLQLGTRIAS